MKKRLAALLPGFCLLAFHAGHAGASCTFEKGFSTLNIVIPMNGKFTVPRDAPVGTEIARFTWRPTPNEFYALCKRSGQRDWRVSNLLYGQGTNKVYPTNVAGVGVKIMNQSTLFPTSGKYSTIGAINYFWGGQNLNYVLVKTGPVSYGSIAAANLPTVRYDFDGTLVIYNASATGSVTISPAACSTPNVTVRLGEHKTSELSGPGSSTSATAFRIALNDCPAGMKTIKYQIDATTPVLGASNSVVALNATSTATGVGVQLLDNEDRPFPLGTPRTLSGYNAGTGGSYSVPLKARYYQTDTKTTAGTANTGLTFMMNYQ